MDKPQPQFLDVGRGAGARRIAYLAQDGSSPGILWLQGFKSDMISLKATALARWTAAENRAFTRFDYSGHGFSGGQFEDGTLSHWLQETEAVFTRITTGPQIVIGSSMGGNIALLLLRRFLMQAPPEAARIQSLILIAPAWDMTEELMWRRFSSEIRQTIMKDGVWLRPSQYGDAYPITRNLIEDGRQNLIGTATWDPGRPVHIIHGRLDPDVPFSHSERLLKILQGTTVTLTEVPEGEHRLSRPQDLELLISIVNKATAVNS